MKLPTSSMMGPKSRIMVTVKVSSDCEDGFDDDDEDCGFDDKDSAIEGIVKEEDKAILQV